MGQGIWDHLVAAGDWGAEFRCTPQVIEMFNNRKIFFGVYDAIDFSGDEVVRFDSLTELEPYSFFNSHLIWSMGSFSFSWSDLPGSFSSLPSKFKVGRYCSIAEECKVFHSGHPIDWATSSPVVSPTRRENPVARAGKEEGICGHYIRNGFYSDRFDGSWINHENEIKTAIQHDVWIGWRVQLARNITVGTGAVIATGAIVTKDVEPYMIVGGIPARVIRPRFTEKIIERFLKSKWWEYGPGIFELCDYKNPEKFLDDFEQLKEDKTVLPYNPDKTTFRHIMNDLMNNMDKL
jgi:virginiamycin A acetyltransferase